MKVCLNLCEQIITVLKFSGVARWAQYVYTKTSANSYQPMLCKTQKSKKLTTLWWNPEFSKIVFVIQNATLQTVIRSRAICKAWGKITKLLTSTKYC
jgi:hypothetical protein